MTTSIQTLPRDGRHFSARPLWAAIAVLGVAVIALGASLIHVQTRPVDGHAVLVPDDLAAWPDAAQPAPAETRLPVHTVAPGETVLPGRAATAARAAAAPATGTAKATAPRQDGRDARPVASPPAAGRSDLPAAPPDARPRATPLKEPAPAPAAVPAPVSQASPAPYTVTESGVVLPRLPVPDTPVAATVCGHCGRVESVTPIQRPGTARGVGAVAGSVLGAVVGNQIGKGNGRTIATIVGAVGGGVAGHAIEQNMATVTVYLVQLRMDDGSVRQVESSTPPALGSAVVLDGQSLRSADGGRVVSTGNTPAAPAAQP